MKTLIAGEEFTVTVCDNCHKRAPAVVRVLDSVYSHDDAEVGITYDLCHKCLAAAAREVRPHFLSWVWKLLGVKS